jgi:AGCS family alanine or glycine:cation symporter
MAWKKSIPVFLKIIRNDKSTSGSRLVSHKKAFFTIVAATVGIGNIAGVGTAIHLGGPGALFWMWVSALFGMFFRMASTYMAIKVRPVDDRSLSFATPMVYLEKYMKGSLSFVPKLVAVLILIQGVVLYNMVQSNSLAQAVHNRFGVSNLLIALLLTFFVGIIILGGLKKIVDFSSVIAPVMIIVYVVAGLIVLIVHPVHTTQTLGTVFASAFTKYSIAGGVAGYGVLQAMQFGISRGVFSHMSGMGTSPFFQAANKDTPAMGAFMSAITPFVDTIIICTVTGLVVLSGPYWQVQTGAHLTADSFEVGIGIFGQVIVILCLIVFALTTITAFAHVSERCFEYLGGNVSNGFRFVLLLVTFIGPFLNLRFVWSLSDIIIAATIVFHLFPLMYIMLKTDKKMHRDLNKFADGIV